MILFIESQIYHHSMRQNFYYNKIASVQIYISQSQRIIIQMIQTQICPNCYSQIPSEDFRDHSQSCSQNQSIRPRFMVSMKSKQKRIYLNVQLMKPYFVIKKFRNTIFQKVENIIQAQFEDVIKQFKVVLTPQQAYLLILSQNQSQYVLNHLQTLIENQINGYEVVHFKIEETYSKVLFNLEDQFIFEQKDSEIYFIEKKNVILEKIVQFFSAVLSLQKVAKKFDLASQILEVEEDKEKQVKQLMNFIYGFIAQKEHLTIKTKKTQKKCFIFISGLQQSVRSCKQYLQDSFSGVDSMESVRYKISEEEYKIIKRQKILQKFKQEIGLKYEIKNFVISKTFHVKKNSSIYLLCNRNLFTIPKSSVIILPQSLMKEVKQAQQSMNSLKQYIFFSPQQDKQVQEAIQQFIQFYIQKQGQIGVILPDSNKQKFIQRIINILKTQHKNITIYLLERSNEKLAVEALKQSVSQRVWYTYIKQQKVYYPEKVCEKIEEALSNKLELVEITHEDLDIKTKNHIYNPQYGVIIHQKSKNETNVDDQGHSLVAFLAQGCYTIKKNNKDKQVTFGVYQLDLKRNLQLSILSGTKRKINFQQKREKSNKIQDQKTEIEMILKYPDLETIGQIWIEIQKTVGNQKIHKTISIQGIQKQKLSHIENWCKLNKIEIMINDKQLQVNSFYQSAIFDLEKLIQLHKKKLISGDIQYPPFWQDQDEELQLYNIVEGSQQFKIVQNNFKVGKIRKLQRIQNKLLFDKYSLEKKFLEEQNGQKIRQIMMYHGTRGNQPSKIYADREESFNINYANMGSFGKGIYFAKNSEYSNNYCFMSKGGKQMFYCLVLAGHSEVYNRSQQLDTNFRDPVKKIRYESVTDHAHQTIIVVFKNRRAYPLYLITY